MGIISLSHAPFSVPATGEASNSLARKWSHLADGRNPPGLVAGERLGG